LTNIDYQLDACLLIELTDIAVKLLASTSIE